jgi:hypothetical protein
MPNPLVDELSDDAKAELAFVFAALRQEYPPVRYDHLGGYVRMPMYLPKPWKRSGWW